MVEQTSKLKTLSLQADWAVAFRILENKEDFQVIFLLKESTHLSLRAISWENSHSTVSLTHPLGEECKNPIS